MRKKRNFSSVLAWGNSLLSLIFVILSILLYRSNLPGGIVQRGYHLDISNSVMAISFPLVGAVILTRMPRHPIGWLLFWIGLLQSLQQLATQYGIYALYTQSNPTGPLAAWLAGSIWFPSFCLFILLLMLFPNGRGLEGSWSKLTWLPWAGLYGSISIAVFSLFRPFEGPYFDPSVSATSGILDYIFLFFFILLIVSVPAAGAIMVRRFRNSRGVERQQMKWFAMSGAVWVTFFIILILFDILQLPISLIIDKLGRFFLLPFATAAIPASLGFAILKYRLYDIDLLIRKTLVYSLLTGSLALVYFGSVILFEGLLRTITGQMGQSSIAIVLSTLLIAALFNPLRLSIKSSIDKRFYRSKYNAQRTLEIFAASLRDEVDLDELSARLGQVVQETIQPQGLSLWLKKDG